MREKRRRQGFVLLLTLVIIALAGFVLASLARHRLKVAASTRHSYEELQHRWGTTSLRRTLAYQSALIGDSSGSFESVQLGRMSIKVRIDDDSTKLNLNRVLTQGGSESVLRVLAQLSDSQAFVALRNSRILEPNKAYSSWGEVFSLDAVSRSADSPMEWLASSTRNITCWGDGRLHFRHAENGDFEKLIPILPLNVVHKFLDLRRLKPRLSKDQLLSELDVSLAERIQLEGWLTDSVQCRTIWMVSETKSRTHHEQVVVEEKSFGAPRVTLFSW